MKRNFVNRYFRCPVCGVVITAPKQMSYQSRKGHIKTLYCYKCKCDRQFEMWDSDLGRLRG